MNRLAPLTATMKVAWTAIIQYFEHGDLVPLIVLISAWHYSSILRPYDHAIAAVAIGTLVDLGHYRWTKAAVRYSGEDTREKIGRWVMVLVMSAIALNYQQRFYNDWWLSVPMPLLIASLAWLNQKDSKSQQKANKSEKAPAISESVPAKAEPVYLTCEVCGATHGKSGNPISTQAAMNAHMKAHKPAALPLNGKAHPSAGNGAGE